MSRRSHKIYYFTNGILFKNILNIVKNIGDCRENLSFSQDFCFLFLHNIKLQF